MGEGFFFNSRGHGLYGFLETPPALGLRGRTDGAVIVHPFMEERQDAHSVLGDIARRLAATGRPALRFDLYGHGDSAGDWRDATVEGWLDDIATAVDELRVRTGVTRVGLYGLRFGATLAALAARALAPERLVLWQPVVRGDAYVMELLRAHLSAEMVLHKRVGVSREALIQGLERGDDINLFGYRLSLAQYRGVSAVDLTLDLKGYAGRTLLVDVVRMATARENLDTLALAEAIGASATVTKVVETQSLYAEGKVLYTRADNLVAETLAWLEAP